MQERLSHGTRNIGENKKILTNCGFLKTFLMLLVILGHACIFWTGTWFTKNPMIDCSGLSTIASWLNSFHIYTFSLVSGYIFAFKILSRGGYSHYGLFLKNKAKRLLVPYAFVMLIWVAPISVHYFKLNTMEWFRNYILCISPSQLWFLWMLFGVFAIVWPLRNVMIKKPLAGWMISLVFYGVGVIGEQFVSNVFCIWTACQYIVFFFIGMRIRVKSEKQERQLTDAVPWFCWIAIDIVLFAGNKLIGQQNGFIWNVISLETTFLLHVVGALTAWTNLQVLASRIHWQDSKAFKTLASYSMPMYLFHQQIIYFTIDWLNGKINPWIHADVNLVLAIVGSLIISIILMRWKITRFLIGEKA